MNLRPNFLALALVGLPMATAAAANISEFERRCEKEMRPHIQISAFQADIRIDNTVGSRVLHTRAQHVYGGDQMLGMTALKSRVEIDIDGPALVDRDLARECIAPLINVTLSYHPMDVFIAREFSPVSCSYRAILEHEMQHVQRYRDNLPRVEALVRAELSKRYRDGPLYAASGMGLNMLQADVDSWLRPMIQGEFRKIETLQHELDTEEESARLSLACHGELASNLGTRY